MADHPSRDELSGFVLGTLPPESIDAVAEHLGGCTPCMDTIHQLDDVHKDTLQQWLRKEPPPPVDPTCRDAVQKAAALAAEQSSTRIKRAAEPSVPSLTSAAAAQPICKEKLLANLRGAGILSAEVLHAIDNDPEIAAAPDAQAAARKLVEQYRITKFQAQHLYQGKTRGFLFGEYVVLDKLGAGGMGQVFKARHRRMDRIVALKVMSSAAMKNADAVKRFQREVKAAARLSHPNIVTAYDAGEQEGIHFLVMEYVEGSDLSERIKKNGPLPVGEAADAMLQAARGLAFAHEEGVVHRDIKPANLLVDKKGIVKILDMGLARMDDPLGDANDGLTQSGQVMGTVDYMAPEQAFNTREATASADVYSLGCTLYRLLTNQPMYEGQSVVEKILAHREKPIPVLKKHRPDAPDALVTLFEQMSAKQVADRPKMGQVVERLEAIVAALVSRDAQRSAPPAIAIDTGPVSRDAERQATGRDAQRSAPAAKPQAIRSAGRGKKPPRKLILAAAGAAGLIVAALGLWIVLKGPDGKPYAQIEVDLKNSVSIQNQPAVIEPNAADATNVSDADRTAAEWILSRKGTAHILVDGQARAIKDIASLPAGPFKMNGIGVSAVPLSLDDLHRLAPLRLSIFDLRQADVTDAHLAIIADNPELRELSLFQNRDVTNAGVGLLTRCSKLELLSLQRTQVTDAVVPDLAKIRSLKTLTLNDQPVTDTGLAPLAELPELETLYVDACFQLTGEFANHLRGNSKLTTLQLGRTPFTRKGLEAVAKLSQLQNLLLNTANGIVMPAEWLSVFANHPSLTELNIAGDTVGDGAVEYLKRIPKLEKLHVANTGLTAAGLTELRKAKPDLQIIGAPADPSPPVPTSMISMIQPGDYALEFDGRSARVDIPSMQLAALGDLTVEVTLTVQGPPQIGNVLELICANGDTAYITIDPYRGHELKAGVFSKGQLISVGEPVLLEAGKKTRLALVFHDGDFRLFQDGKRLNIQIATGELPIKIRPASLTIGSVGPEHTQQRFHHGLIDEIRVARVARYDTDYAPTESLEADADTLALYHFDEGTGDMLTDASGHNHHGKIVGAKWVRADSSAITGQELPGYIAGPSGTGTLPPSTPSPANIPSDATSFGGKSYKFYNERLTRSQAVARCAAMGGHLPVVRSAEENQFLVDLLNPTMATATWLAASDEQQEGTWRWPDGSVVTYAKWESGQPDNGGPTTLDEDFAIIRKDKAGRWWDYPDDPTPLPGNQPRPAFVCVWDAQPNVNSGTCVVPAPPSQATRP